MLLKLRVLGKFLGYLFFCPYNYPMPNYIVSEVTEIRNNVNYKDFKSFYSLLKLNYLHKFKELNANQSSRMLRAINR
jgi:hypothetical protein